MTYYYNKGGIMTNRTYSTFETAEILGVSVRRIQKMITEKLITAKNIGRDYVISEKEILRIKEEENKMNEKRKGPGRPRNRKPKKLIYVSDPTDEYIKIVDNILLFLEKEGLDRTRRAFADATSQQIRSESMFGFKEKGQNHVCVYRLLGKKKCLHTPDNETAIIDIPGQDHLSEWTKEGSTEKIISQPYSVSYETLKELIIFCEENGLRADFSGLSWHFPGRTIRIDLSKNQ
jgi:excisionase family DNA binding protein